MRLFVAVNLPEAVRREIWETAAPLRRRGFPVRWVDSDGIHLTLKFLGEVPEDREPEICKGLQAAVRGGKTFTLQLAGFGAFPTPQRPRVVWLGCEAAPPLEILQHRVEQEMEQLGFPVEGRAFRPHLTLGRARSGARSSDTARLPAALEQLDFAATVPVTSVDLMESRLAPGGASYTRRCAVPLGD